MHRAEARYELPTSDEALIARHAGLIDRVARRLAVRLRLSDGGAELWSAGALGLIDAARRFDGSRSVRFETFAEHRIRGAMLDELRNLDHLPRRLRADTERVQKARSKLEQRLGRDASSDELAAELGLSAEELAELEQVSQPVAPLEAAFGVASADESPEISIDRSTMAERLTGAVGRIDARLQTLLSLYYVEELAFREVAKVLGISEARVCQLHRDALQRLRELLAE